MESTQYVFTELFDLLYVLSLKVNKLGSRLKYQGISDLIFFLSLELPLLLTSFKKAFIFFLA